MVGVIEESNNFSRFVRNWIRCLDMIGPTVADGTPGKKFEFHFLTKLVKINLIDSTEPKFTVECRNPNVRKR